jgi:hypothetical protein
MLFLLLLFLLLLLLLFLHHPLHCSPQLTFITSLQCHSNVLHTNTNSFPTTCTASSRTACTAIHDGLYFLMYCLCNLVHGQLQG